MKILKEGTLPEPVEVYEGECEHCACEVECEPSEVRKSPEGFAVHCPTPGCFQRITMKPVYWRRCKFGVGVVRKVALLLVLFLPATAQAQTYSVWSYQRDSGVKHSHTWLTVSDGKETVCISFGPLGDTALIRRAETGRNQTHQETLAWARYYGAEVRQHGPYPCSPTLFARAKAQRDRLERGEVRYKLVYLTAGPWRANCFGACAAISERPIVQGILYGHAASRFLAECLRGQ